MAKSAAERKAAQRARHDLTKQDIVGPVGGKGTNGPAAVCNGGAHGQGVHQVHHHCKDGQCQHTVGNDPVDLIGNGQVLHAGLVRVDDRHAVVFLAELPRQRCADLAAAHQNDLHRITLSLLLRRLGAIE